MSFGSGGVGGRRYQITAVLLTYLAVSMSAVPIAIYQMRQHQAQAQAPAQSGENATVPKSQHMSLAKALGVLTLLGVASPFLDLQNPVHGLIGLVILSVGIRFAWRFTAGPTLDVSGPHAPPAPGVI
jgi:hypothetical protein